uniref:DNA2/NAM7 helicase-like C-terminal domain-containing protein n=1 Tax=Timema genevievae TaxID=629358 RepID=A0A7R9PP34_TIMGE|nr:unnamed protein product [Timema genevievae]
MNEKQALRGALVVLSSTAEDGEIEVRISAQKFKQAMKKKNWQEVSVGSVEEFQGQERLIIIISTVRSSHELLEDDYKFRLGFLDNPKRFNVAMTRAKSLLIVVGNPNILQCDYYWHQLLNYCHKNDAYRGVKFPLHKKSPVDRLIKDMKQLNINTGLFGAGSNIVILAVQANVTTYDPDILKVFYMKNTDSIRRLYASYEVAQPVRVRVRWSLDEYVRVKSSSIEKKYSVN